MITHRIYSRLSAVVFCTLLLTVGCTQQTKEIGKVGVETKKQTPQDAPGTCTLALKFTQQDATTYKVITESEQDVKLEGKITADDAFKSGRSYTRMEITFIQDIGAITDEGEGVAQIIIKNLKYLSIIRNNTIIDFDSSRDKDQNSPLAKLVGQRYLLRITPDSQIPEVAGLYEPHAAVLGNTFANKIATKLVDLDAIEERHIVPALPPIKKSRLHTGDTWSKVKTFSFGLMGTKSYERIYTLKEIKDTAGRRTAIVDMNAIPASQPLDQPQKQSSDFSKMFDNSGTYTGHLTFDLTAGKVEKYTEKLNTEWITINPAAKPEGNEPDVLKMNAVRSYSIEKID